MTEEKTRKAPHDLYGTDGVGVRRFIAAGDVIPAGLVLEEDIDFDAADVTDEDKRVAQERAAREPEADEPSEDEPEADPEPAKPAGRKRGGRAKA